MTIGTITLNGISDEQLIEILERKRDEPYFSFSPQLLETMAVRTLDGGAVLKQTYNNVVLSWQHDLGLRAINRILNQFCTAIRGDDDSPAAAGPGHG